MKRYDLIPNMKSGGIDGIEEHESGDWVRFEDIDALQQSHDRLKAEIGVLHHSEALVEARTRRGITDASTPLHIRVENIVQQLEKAEADVARLKAAFTAHCVQCPQCEESWRAALAHPASGETA